ncbi:MAG: hypothetical protein ACOC9Y_03535 [Chloroflexota bacterium]
MTAARLAQLARIHRLSALQNPKEMVFEGRIVMRRAVATAVVLALGLGMAFSAATVDAESAGSPSTSASGSVLIESSADRAALAWSIVRWPLAAIFVVAVLLVAAIQIGIFLDYREGRVQVRSPESERHPAVDVDLGTVIPDRAQAPVLQQTSLHTAPLQSIGD